MAIDRAQRLRVTGRRSLPSRSAGPAGPGSCGAECYAGLAPEYRKRQAAKIRVTAQQELAAAAKAIQAEHDRKLRAAQNPLFGLADEGGRSLDAARIAHHDAGERASRCETYEQAALLLDRATVNGDAQLASAAFAPPPPELNGLTSAMIRAARWLYERGAPGRFLAWLAARSAHVCCPVPP